jgi:hypothetical protein
MLLGFKVFWFCMFHPMCNMLFCFVVMSILIILSLLCNIHLVLGLACVLMLIETMQSLLKFAQMRNIFICDFIVVMNVYMLYCDAMSSFQSDAFWSFHGLLRLNHQQTTNLKWIIDYNIDSNEHIAFVWKDENLWVHRGCNLNATR